MDIRRGSGAFDLLARWDKDEPIAIEEVLKSAALVQIGASENHSIRQLTLKLINSPTSRYIFYVKNKFKLASISRRLVFHSCIHQVSSRVLCLSISRLYCICLRLTSLCYSVFIYSLSISSLFLRFYVHDVSHIVP